MKEVYGNKKKLNGNNKIEEEKEKENKNGEDENTEVEKEEEEIEEDSKDDSIKVQVVKDYSKVPIRFCLYSPYPNSSLFSSNSRADIKNPTKKLEEVRFEV
jgi:hypothetical protein